MTLLTRFACILLAFCPMVMADQLSDLKEEIAHLKEKTAALESHLEQLSVAEKHEESTLGSTSFVDVNRTRSFAGPNGPYFGSNATFDGSMLLINEPTLNKDLGLLRQKQYVNKAFGRVAETGARLELSGTVYAQYFHHSHTFGRDGNANHTDKGHSNFLADAELDISAQLNDWWLTYSKFAADTDNTDVSLDLAFITLGDLDTLPLYASVGYFYMPFGNFSSRMISSNLPKRLGRTKARGLAVGYSEKPLNASVFAFSSDVQDSSQRRVDQWGANAEYVNKQLISLASAPLAITLGASYSNNLLAASSQPDFLNDRVNAYVDAYDLRAVLEYRQFGIRAEYIAPFERYDSRDLLFNGLAAKPTASLYELSYDFNTYTMPSYVALSYSESTDALALAIPKYQVGAAYSVRIYPHVSVIFEYLRKKDYSINTTSAVSAGSVLKGSGLTNHVFTTEIDLYF